LPFLRLGLNKVLDNDRSKRHFGAVKPRFMLTADEFARALGLSRSDLYRYIELGMPAHTIRGAVSWLAIHREDRDTSVTTIPIYRARFHGV